jgi:hypothetical protein
MKTPGQVWVLRRLKDLISDVEEATTHVDTDNYKDFEEYATEVYELALHIYNGHFDDELDDFLPIHDSILSAMSGIFDNQLKDYYGQSEETLNESFDKILDLYTKKREGIELKPSEQTMMRTFQKFVDKGGNAEEFEYSDDVDNNIDKRDGETFTYNGFDMPLVYTFSEETEEDGEINYFGEVKFEDDEFLGVITTDKRGFVIDYDFYSVLEDDVRLQDILKDLQIEDEVMNFFSEEVIPSLRNLNEGFITESDLPVNNIEKLKRHWRNQLRQGKQIRFDNEELDFWGINRRAPKRYAQIAFQELVGDEKFTGKFIDTLLNKTFSTKDFSEKIVGGYDFEWTITEVEYRDFDFYLYGATLQGGTVTLMDGRNISLDEALDDEDLSWEIQSEIDEVAQDCMNEIILPVTGYNVDVSLIVK